MFYRSRQQQASLKSLRVCHTIWVNYYIKHNYHNYSHNWIFLLIGRLQGSKDERGQFIWYASAYTEVNDNLQPYMVCCYLVEISVSRYYSLWTCPQIQYLLQARFGKRKIGQNGNTAFKRAQTRVQPPQMSNSLL